MNLTVDDGDDNDGDDIKGVETRTPPPTPTLRAEKVKADALAAKRVRAIVDAEIFIEFCVCLVLLCNFSCSVQFNSIQFE